MQHGISNKRFVMAFASAMIAAIMAQPVMAAQKAPWGITFITFTVPGSAGGSLSVSGINNKAEVVGSYTVSSGTYGFMRSPTGTITPVADPANTGSFIYTAPIGINQNSVITGVFYNTAASAYSGFVDTNGTFATYIFPSLPAGSETAVNQTNRIGALCGFIVPNIAPFSAQAFIRPPGGANSLLFSVTNAADTYCYGINDSYTVGGEYLDSAGVWHGFTRTPDGTVTTIDAPGASTTPGTQPCPTQNGGNPIAGTVVQGINASGDVSGHFWDTSYNEHGFVLSHTGVFTQIDVPGAFQTAGGGVNDFGEVVGHYTDASCNPFGYTAQIQSHQY
jgi:hypothetical protein